MFYNNSHTSGSPSGKIPPRAVPAFQGQDALAPSFSALRKTFYFPYVYLWLAAGAPLSHPAWGKDKKKKNVNKFKSNADIFGKAIKDYFQQKKAQDIIVHSPDFEDDVIPVSYLFRTYDKMPLLEKVALDQCRGKTLDVGCGAGSHSLYLQEERKLKITAIDTSKGAMETYRERGIKDARAISFYEISEEKYDTILLLMNGTGIIGKMANLDHFFLKLKELLQPNGQVLLDSSDLSFLFDPDEDSGFWVNPEEG